MSWPNLPHSCLFILQGQTLKTYRQNVYWQLEPVKTVQNLVLFCLKPKNYANNKSPQNAYCHSDNISITKMFEPRCKIIVRHKMRTVISWANPNQWLTIHTSDLIMIIR